MTVKWCSVLQMGVASMHYVWGKSLHSSCLKRISRSSSKKLFSLQWPRLLVIENQCLCLHAQQQAQIILCSAAGSPLKPCNTFLGSSSFLRGTWPLFTPELICSYIASIRTIIYKQTITESNSCRVGSHLKQGFQLLSQKCCILCLTLCSHLQRGAR